MFKINEENIYNTEQVINGEIDSTEAHREFNLKDNERMEELLKKYNGGNYLELGPCNMPTAKIAKERFPESEVYALDISSRIIEIFQKKAPDVIYKQHDLNKRFPFPDEYFSYITAGEIIEHVDSPQEFLNECKRVLKKGGWIALSTPLNENSNANRGGRWHIWSFDLGDISKLWGGDCEEIVLKQNTNKNIVIWCQKL